MRRLRMLVAASLAAVALGGLSASAAGTSAGTGGYWIVIRSDRDGQDRAYSVRPDGSRLTPLFPPGSKQYPFALSGDGTTIVYDDLYGGGISVSRADGTGLRKLVRDGGSPALSRDGKLLAFAVGFPQHIEVIATDGSGRRRLTPGSGPNWSPDGRALTYERSLGKKQVIVVQPLHGPQRVLVRGPADTGPGSPEWSPDGRLIAYLDGGRLWVVRPDGTQRRRVAKAFAFPFTWSPDGKKIAYGFGDPSDIAVVGADGRGLRRLRLRGVSSRAWPLISSLSWSPDGRLLALKSEIFGGSKTRLWVVCSNGRGLRQVASAGDNALAGWTGIAPARRPAAPLLPSERVLDTNTIATHTPISGLAADGQRVAFAVEQTAIDCDHVAVWSRGTQALARFGHTPCHSDRSIYDVELAGTRVAWAEIRDLCSNYCDVALESATLARRSPLALSVDDGAMDATSGEGGDYHVHGDGDLLVFNDLGPPRLVRIGAGREQCYEAGNSGASVCATVRRGVDAAPVVSVSGALIATRQPTAVTVLDKEGKLVRAFPFPLHGVSSARLDGGRLFVARRTTLEAYDVATGDRKLSRPLPSGYGLQDVDGGIALLRSGDTIMLLRLSDGRSLTLAPGRGPRFADLEPPGLYYSYAMRDGGGRLVFVSRAALLRQLR